MCASETTIKISHKTKSGGGGKKRKKKEKKTLF